VTTDIALVVVHRAGALRMSSHRATEKKHAVASKIRQQLRPPIFCVCLWIRAVNAASVLMPKTSMNENRDPVFGQNDVWFTGQIFSMQPISISELVQTSSHSEFGIGVP
jgi:hypothetical protein